MGRRPNTRRLDLWMNGERVGLWCLGPSAEELTYAESWIRSPLGRPLSISLPFQPDNRPHKGAAVRAYFENLLPDSRSILGRIARRHHTGSTSPFDLLAKIGGDCVGALQVMPEGEDPGDVRRITGLPLDSDGVARELAEAIGPVAQSAEGDRADALRLSIAGAQEKAALLWHDERWMRPTGATPTTHILKLPLGLIGGSQLNLHDAVENEWLCGRIVHAFGVPIAESRIERFERFKVLVVKRFDRELSSDGGWYVRLPQEDLCQVTGISPERQCERDGGPGIDRILRLLDSSDAREKDRRNFLKAQILFWMLANTDGHAKNFSVFLRAGGAFRSTPLYDVLSAYPVIGHGANRTPYQDARLAMAVRSKDVHDRLLEIQRRHWNAVAKRNGVAESAEGIIEEVLATTAGVLELVQSQLPADFPGHVAESIFRGVRVSVDRLAKMPRG